MNDRTQVKERTTRTGKKPRKIAHWECPICRARYGSVEQATDCRDRGVTMLALKVGDVVVPMGERFGWFDGDAAWVAVDRADRDDDIKSPSGRSYSFYYVVTAESAHEADAHVRTHTLRTKALLTSYSGGWTCQTHWAVRLVPPQEVPQAVKDSIDELVALGASGHLL